MPRARGTSALSAAAPGWASPWRPRRQLKPPSSKPDAHGTSSRSTKLVRRSVPRARQSLARRQALKERDRLMHNAAGHVDDFGFLIPSKALGPFCTGSDSGSTIAAAATAGDAPNGSAATKSHGGFPTSAKWASSARGNTETADSTMPTSHWAWHEPPPIKGHTRQPLPRGWPKIRWTHSRRGPARHADRRNVFPRQPRRGQCVRSLQRRPASTRRCGA